MTKTPKAPKAPTLAQLVKLADSVVEKRCTIPVLCAGELRRSGADSLLSTTDMDVRCTVGLIGGAVDRDSMIETKAFAAALGKASTFNIRGGMMESGARIGAEHPVSDFPAPEFLGLGDGVAPGRVTYPAGALLRVLDYIAPSVSTEETRYYLNGIYMHGPKVDGARRLRMVATDGHRLHMETFDAPPVYPESARLDKKTPGVIVPRKTIGVMRKALALFGADHPAEMEWTETRFAFRIGTVCVASKTIDGTFPDYERVFPSGDVKQAVTFAADAGASLDASAKIARGRSGAERVTQAFIRPELGAIVPQWKEEAADAVACVNSYYLADMLAGGACVGHIVDHGSPLRFTFPDSPGRVGLLMPMRGDGAGLPSRVAAEREAAEFARREALLAGLRLQCIAAPLDDVRECIAMPRESDATFAGQCIAEPLTEAEADAMARYVADLPPVADDVAPVVIVESAAVVTVADAPALPTVADDDWPDVESPWAYVPPLAVPPVGIWATGGDD